VFSLAQNRGPICANSQSASFSHPLFSHQLLVARFLYALLMATGDKYKDLLSK
jgi:hypothetical protein